MIDWINSMLPAWNSGLAILLYWLPLILCFYGYTVFTIRDYRAELVRRSNDHYYPTLTFGTIIGRLLVTLIPVVNLFAATFDVAPKVFSDLFGWFKKTLNIPLVPPRPK